MSKHCVRWKFYVVYSTILISFLIILLGYIDGNEAKSDLRLNKNNYSRFKVNGHNYSSISNHSSPFMSNYSFMTNHSFKSSFNSTDDGPNCRPIKSNATDDCFLTTAQIIERNGYCAETHQLTTEDGYRLQFFRLRESCPRDCFGTNQPVVILVHGMLGSSSDFVFAGVEKGLGFQLMYNGFDVWLLNLRGNVYGGLQNKPGDFWDFSFHEMGNYDLPAYIDYILDYTRQEKLFYVGFSMGTTSAYVLLSMRPDYNQKIIRMANMAPVVFLDHSETTVGGKMIVKISHWYEKTSNSVKANGYKKKPIKLLTAPECLRPLKRYQCERIMVYTCSNKTLSHNDKELWDSFFRTALAGGSSKAVAHFLQISQSAEFESEIR
ncbi:lipase 1-like isoform X2 [Nilaparvata lugens]|uniref:lipase 1-like isoform X2 n=1 Tax=Nilaparvata lugens TaxID=108931 RepID=UPI00193E52C4|nr:lipase 1-like isoform X2 [Nilaparvata lugens]